MGCGCRKKSEQPPAEVAQTAQPLQYTAPIEEYSLKDAVLDTVYGRAEIVSAEAQRERLLICGACPHIKRPFFRCGVCGCLMRKKTRFAKASCPLRMEKNGENPRWIPIAGIGIEEDVEDGLLDS